MNKHQNIVLGGFLTLAIIGSTIFVSQKLDKSIDIEKFNQFESMLKESKERLSVLEAQQKNLSNVFEALKTDVSAFSQTISSFDGIVGESKKTIGEFANQQKDLDLIVKDLRTQEGSFKENISIISGAITERLKDQVLGNQKAGEKAFELAKNAEAQKNYDLAELYYLSAINHLPSETKFLKGYLDFVLSENKNLQSLSRASEILDLALYQANPNDIVEILGSKTKIEEAERKLLGDNDNASEKEKEDFSKNYKIVINGALSCDEIAQSENISDMLRERQSMLGELLQNSYADKSDIENLKAEIDKTNSLLMASIALDSADGVLEKIGPIDGNTAKMTQLQLNAANNYLTQAWTENLSKIPSLDKKAKKISEEIIIKEKKVFEILAKPYEKKIDKLTSEISTITGLSDSTTEDIEKASNLLKEAYKNLAKIQDEETAAKCQKEIEDKALAKVKELEKKRYEKYQRWAIKNISEANFELDNGNDALDIFEEHLQKINTSLLLPDIAALYAEVFSKCRENSKDKMSIVIKKAEANKKLKPLEDF